MEATLMSSEFDKRVEEFFRTYQDRGMKKWAGFYLSDHTAKINLDKKRRETVYVKKKTMSQKDIRAMLLKSFGEHRKVSVQLKDLSVEMTYRLILWALSMAIRKIRRSFREIWF